MNYRIRKSLQYLEDTGKKFAQRFGRISATRAGAAKVVVFFIAFFIGAVSLIPLGIVKVDFMGNIDSNNVRINVKYAPGITIQENQKYTSQISNDILDYYQFEVPASRKRYFCRSRKPEWLKYAFCMRWCDQQSCLLQYQAYRVRK